MAVRAGLEHLATQLRLMTDTTADTEAIGTINYLSDAQLEVELDKVRIDYYQLPLYPIRQLVLGSPTSQTVIYPFPMGIINVEKHSTNDAFSVYKLNGELMTVGVADTQYQPDYDARKVVFNGDTLGLLFYLDVRTFNLNMAASNIWNYKASIAAGMVDWRSDNHAISNGQIQEHCLERAKFYSGAGGLRNSKMVRLDEVRR